MATTQNLVVNGDCETGSLATDYGTWVAPASWTIDQGQLDAQAYSAGGGTDLNTAYANAHGFGLGYFSGGPGAGFSSAYQTIDLSTYASDIDAGGVTFNLAGEFGGFSSQDDYMSCTITFYAANGTTVLGTADTIGHVTAADRGNISELLHRADTGAVPVGARFVKVELDATRSSGSYNDGYADNISLTLSGDHLLDNILVVKKTHDYSLASLSGIDTIQFSASKAATATFISEQFGAGIAADAHIVGDSHTNTLVIYLSTDIFDGSALTFESWDAKDTVAIAGNSNDETIIGTSIADVITSDLANDPTAHDRIVGGGGADILRCKAGEETFVYTAAAESASKTYDTIEGLNGSADDFIDVSSFVNFDELDAPVEGTLSTKNFDKNLKAALDPAHLGKNDGVLFTANGGNLSGHTFLIIDGNHKAGYQAGHDLVIELVSSAGFEASNIIG